MSRSFGRFFHLIDLNADRVVASTAAVLLGTVPHAFYAKGTSQIEDVVIVEKYTMVRGGFTEFMAVDLQGRHFNVNNSFWYNKWDSVEDWSQINKGHKITIQYYGWRIPVLGLFPNIVCCNVLRTVDHEFQYPYYLLPSQETKDH